MKKSIKLFLTIIILGSIFTSCTPKETITDVYFIHNDLDETVLLEVSCPLFWDTCSTYSTGTCSQVWYEEQELAIPAHTTIRLHPICREYGNPSVHTANPISIIGATTNLIVGTDTIRWQAAEQKRPPMVFPSMFTDDALWSIYNTESWQTVSDSVTPYTYYNTFLVTRELIERSQTL